MPKIPQRRLAFDVETPGLDLRRGCHPFFVSFADDQENNIFFEWDVDPLTREVKPDLDDLEQIRQLIETADVLICHGAKFDITGLQQHFKGKLKIDWKKVRCTLMSAHLVASNHPHDLTSQAINYLKINLKPYEDRLEEAVKEARRLIDTKEFIAKHGQFKIARKGMVELPSSKDEFWRCDYWLPRAVAKAENYPEDHPWCTVLQEYANPDPVATYHLNIRHEQIIKQRGLWNIYLERLKLLPIVYSMEEYGVTGSLTRLEDKLTDYRERAEEYEAVCKNIASDFNYDIELPAGGRNKSLDKFFFDVLKLPVVKTTKKGNASIDKTALGIWEVSLEQNTKPVAFIQNLIQKRSVDTAITYLDVYQKFGDVEDNIWFRLHPWLNPVGTNTLRWASENPCEQNISKKELFNLRYCFGPREGREWWSLDAKNIELRLPAFEAGEQAMIDLFNRPKDPPYFGSYHLLVFDVLHPEKFKKYGAKCKEVYESTWYQWTKNGNFAIQYQAQIVAADEQGYQGTADRAYHVPGAQAMIEDKFKCIKELNNLQLEFARQHGYVETIPDKNVSPDKGYPLLCTRDQWGRIKPTIPLSYHVQGSAMWWMMKAKIRVHAFFEHLNNGGLFQSKKWPGGYYITLQIHDELVPDCPRGSGREPWLYNLPIIEEVQRLMELGGDDFEIPTPVSREYHTEGWDVGIAV